MGIAHAWHGGPTPIRSSVNAASEPLDADGGCIDVATCFHPDLVVHQGVAVASLDVRRRKQGFAS